MDETRTGRTGVLSVAAVVALAGPVAGAGLAWLQLRGTRHLEDIWQPFVLLVFFLVVSAAAFCFELVRARGRRVRITCAYLGALLLAAALLFVLMNCA